MITSRFPIWRTNPAGFTISGIWPVITGVLAVVFIPPLIGLILNAVALSSEEAPASSALATFAVIFMVSSFASWVPMIVAVPISGFLARIGYAGWAVAAIGGAIGGFATAVVLARTLLPTIEFLFLVGIGATLAMIYWGAIRMMHPTAIGVPFHA